MICTIRMNDQSITSYRKFEFLNITLYVVDLITVIFSLAAHLNPIKFACAMILIKLITEFHTHKMCCTHFVRVDYITHLAI